MRINLTFIFQLLNILATLWFLRHFFWQELLSCVFNEQKQTEHLSQSCSLLEKKIQDANLVIQQEQAVLTKTLQEKLQRLETDSKTQAPPQPHILQPHDVTPERSVIAQGIQKIAPILDKKF